MNDHCATLHGTCACGQDEDSSPYKVKLEFNMPMARDDLTLALKGPDCFFILHSLHEDFRQKLKHDDTMTNEEYGMLEWTMDKLHNKMDDEGITLDMVE